MFKLICTLVITAWAASPAFSIVIKDTYGATSGALAAELSKTFGAAARFDAVVGLYNSAGFACTGALISSTSVLTARHCTNELVDTDWQAYVGSNASEFDSYGVTSIAKLAGDPSDPTYSFNGTDLAVMTLSEAVVGIEPMEFLSVPDYGETFAIVGFGRTGVGSTGATNPIDWNRRYATNTYDLAETHFDGNTLLFADFDNEDGTENTLGTLGNVSSPIANLYEGLMGGGDSGGPMLFMRDGEWVIGGVATGIRSFDGQSNADYGDLGIWTGLQSDAAIELLLNAGGVLYEPADPHSVVPIPPSAVFLATSMIGLGAFRRLSTRARQRRG